MEKRSRFFNYVKTIRKCKQCGFALTEAALATVVVAMAFMAFTQMFEKNHEKQLGQIEAEQIGDLRSLATQFFLNNRQAMLKAMEDGTDANKYCVINATAYDEASGTFTGTVVNDLTKHTCAMDASVLHYMGLWPYSPPKPNVDHYVAIFKREYGPGADGTLGTPDDEPTDAVSILLVKIDFDNTPSPESVDRTYAAKSMLGASGGLVPENEMPNCPAGYACGNGWKVKLSDFL